MFGRHQWFKSNSGKMQLRPRTWHGWFYLAGWSAVVVLPVLMLTSRHLAPEAFTWLAASSTAFAWDVRRVRRQWNEPLDVREIFVIDERGARIERQGA